MTQDEIQVLLDAPAFSHTRAGQGCWRDVVFIYHRNSSSPSGVLLAGACDETVFAKCRVPAGGQPLSPTERR